MNKLVVCPPSNKCDYCVRWPADCHRGVHRGGSVRNHVAKSAEARKMLRTNPKSKILCLNERKSDSKSASEIRLGEF